MLEDVAKRGEGRHEEGAALHHLAAALVPGIAVAATVLGLNMLGDVLRDVLDPTIMAD